MALVRSYSRLRSRRLPTRPGLLPPDQILEAQVHGLVAIADQDVEVGVDHRGLVAVRDLEGRGLDAVGLVGLGLELGVCNRIDDSALTRPPEAISYSRSMSPIWGASGANSGCVFR
jgi:hypothetical protein